METSILIRALRLLVDDLAVLGDCVDLDTGRGGCDRKCNLLSVCLSERASRVFGVGEIEVVVCLRVWSFTNSPGYIKLSGLVCEPVNVGIVIFALEILVHLAPLTRCRGIAMDPRISRTRHTDTELHEQVAVVDAFEAGIGQGCPWPDRSRKTVLNWAKCTCIPTRRDRVRDASVTNTIIQRNVMVVETQMNLAIPADAHADGIMFIESLLHVVGKSEVLPSPNGRCNATPPEVDIMLSIASCSLVEGYVLMVAECCKSVLLEG